jgi:hypothetical protein
MRLDHVTLQVHLGAEHDELLVKANPPCAYEVLFHEMNFLQGKSVQRPAGSVAGTNHRLVVLEADRNQSQPHPSQEGDSLFIQGPVLFADEAFFMFLTHVVVQFVVPSGAFTTELAHRVNLDVEVFLLLWLSAGMDRW